MKYLILLLLLTQMLSAQVGINTKSPTATLDVKGNFRVRTVPQGAITDSILVVNNGYVKKIAISSIGSTHKCPAFNKTASHGYYLEFFSDSSIPLPNNAITANNTNFVSAATFVLSNVYHFRYTNTSGVAVNINNLTVNFNGLQCNYN